jgi:hypothetical protein
MPPRPASRPPGHAQAVGAAGNGIARELLEVETMVEQHRLDAELAGSLDQSKLLHLAAARPRVADEDGVLRPPPRIRELLVQRVQVWNERGPRCRVGHREQQREDGDPEEPLIGVGGGPKDGQSNDHKPQGQPADADTTPWHLFRHHPPSAGHCDGDSRECDY